MVQQTVTRQGWGLETSVEPVQGELGDDRDLKSKA